MEVVKRRKGNREVKGKRWTEVKCGKDGGREVLHVEY